MLTQSTKQNNEFAEVNLTSSTEKKKEDKPIETDNKPIEKKEEPAITIKDNVLKDLNNVVKTVLEKKDELTISTTTTEKKKEGINTSEKPTTIDTNKPIEPIKPKKKKKPNEIDYLIEDDPIPNQLWCCISFLSPEGVKNCSLRGIKIRGCFRTPEQAQEHADEVRKKEPYFHVFVGEVGKWLPHDPSPDTCKDQNYMEKELNDLMKEYLKNQEQAKRHHEFRKDQILQKHFSDERTKKMHEKLEKKLEEKKAIEDVKAEPVQNFSSLKECDEKLKRLDDEGKKVKEEREKLQKILMAHRPLNEKTDKVYEKLQKGFTKK